MGRKKNCETVELAAEDIPDLIKAVETNSLSDKHKEIVLTLIRQVVSIHRTAKERAAALKRIKRMLGNSTEKIKKPEDQEKGIEPAPPKKNHGRNGADDFQFANVINYPHQQKCGDDCPLCNHGTLQQLEAGKVIRLTGQPAIIAELHRPEKLRCSGCGETFTAQLPEEIG
jgi:transposase-like protein